MTDRIKGHISPILIGSKKEGIRIVDVRHEVNAVFAADATARLTGVPGVAAVTAGPGVTNTITAVKNAQLAQSPLVLFGGAAGTMLKGRGALQDVDQLSLFKSISKWSATCSRVKDVAPTVREAFKQAMSGVPGPVFVELPIDVLYPYPMVMQEYAGKGGGKSIVAKIISWYLKLHVDNIFAGGWDNTNYSPLPVEEKTAPADFVARAVEITKEAKQPVLILGSQCGLGGMDKAKKLSKAVEGMGIPTFLTGMSRGMLGKSSKVQCRQRRGEALKSADVIILAGVPVDFRLGYGASLNKRAKIITVSRSTEDLNKNQDMFWKSTLKYQADPGHFVLDLASGLPKSAASNSADWLKTLRQRDAEKESSNAKMAEEKVKGINPIKFAHLLEEKLSDDSIIVADGGDFVGTAAYVLRPRGPLTWLDPGVFGTLGVGAGFALAAKLCRPKSEVWIVYGDGSCGYSIAEYDTFARHNLPILSVVGNDACWSQIEREQTPTFGDDVGCPLEFRDYHVVAQGFGGEGVLLPATASDKDIEDGLTKAKEIAKKKPVLVNVIIGKTDFRKGSISV